MKNKSDIEAKVRKEHLSALEILKAVITAIEIEDEWCVPDPDRIVVIDHGDYQGTQLFVFPEKGYQPSQYWAVYFGYGSCSGCDTMQAIRDMSGWDDDKVNEEQVKSYMQVALHFVQGIREI
jgi:hypothetical protein